jgi:hypothetical protein
MTRGDRRLRALLAVGASDDLLWAQMGTDALNIAYSLRLCARPDYSLDGPRFSARACEQLRDAATRIEDCLPLRSRDECLELARVLDDVFGPWDDAPNAANGGQVPLPTQELARTAYSKRRRRGPIVDVIPLDRDGRPSGLAVCECRHGHVWREGDRLQSNGGTSCDECVMECYALGRPLR